MPAHLQAYLRGIGDCAAVILWFFLEGNHGKGPYDPEGGVLKAFVRRMIRYFKATWQNAKGKRQKGEGQKGKREQAKIRCHFGSVRVPPFFALR